jgi:hypothetical protein
LLPFLPSFSLKKKALEKTLLKKEEKKKSNKKNVDTSCPP